MNLLICNFDQFVIYWLCEKTWWEKKFCCKNNPTYKISSGILQNQPVYNVPVFNYFNPSCFLRIQSRSYSLWSSNCSISLHTPGFIDIAHHIETPDHKKCEFDGINYLSVWVNITCVATRKLTEIITNRLDRIMSRLHGYNNQDCL